MKAQPEALSWFGPSVVDEDRDQHPQHPVEFVRLWRGFMTARVTLGLVLVALQFTLLALGVLHSMWPALICCVYFAIGILVRLYYPPQRLGPSFDPQWLLTIGVDLIAFVALQFLQGDAINYALLLALPVLMAAVLGNLALALGTAASATLLLLAQASWLTLGGNNESATRFAQSALTGAGGFAIAFLASQLATLLAVEEKKSLTNLRAVRVQLQINELVIESLSDGVLVVDSRGQVHAANPAARTLLGGSALHQPAPWQLGAEPGWTPLLKLTELSFYRDGVPFTDASIHHSGQGARHVRVRTRLTTPAGGPTESLCVMFLQDQREMEAKMRSAQLASMGRMSLAVAHEIRNPLAAISQANALLEEDLSDPRHRQLTHMVQQNARRLEKIVEDILNVSHVGSRSSANADADMLLDEAVSRICHDWARQDAARAIIELDLAEEAARVCFDPEHLRRVLVNLLDNAMRYAHAQPGAIQISTRSAGDSRVTLGVWSNGAPLDQSVERHLFEPFFSSESRSSGLGLYICRELCEGHGAVMRYQRCARSINGAPIPGNEFQAVLRRSEVKL